MAYTSRDGGQNYRNSSPRRRTQNRNRSRNRNQRGQQSRTRSRNRNLTGPDTGYTLRSHRVNYRRRGATMGERVLGLDGRGLILIVIVVVVIVVLVAGIASCVNSGASTTSDAESEQESEQTEEKPRVASGLSSDLTQEFTAALDRNDQLAQIAQNADQYDDERLLELALREPDAISFVANYLTADKSGSSYGDTVTQGQVPLLYNWDTRWGYVTYGDGCIGVTGSAPTTVAMAYMGLTGKNDKTPATLVQSLSSSSTTTTDSSNSSTSESTSSTSDDIDQLLQSAGLSGTQYESSASTLEACLSDSSLAAVYIGDDALVDGIDAHWALVVGMNDDGTLNVFDPSSTEVSTHTWDSATIANASSSIIYITVSDTADETDDATTSDTTEDDTSLDSDESSDSATSSQSGTSGSSSASSSNSGTGEASSSTSSSQSETTSGSSSTGSSDSSDYVGL